LLEPARRGQHQPVGDVVRERAVDLTERHAALRAARGLVCGLLRPVLVVDLAEIAPARLGGPLFGRALRDSDETEHLGGHGGCPCVASASGGEKSRRASPNRLLTRSLTHLPAESRLLRHNYCPNI